VGGHSKGGNLSVYASVKCREEIQKQIIEVYSNDGPGFKREMIESAEYQRMLPKIKTILPESSIVGMLLEHEEDFEVVKSSNSGIQQHDAMSWEVLGTRFIYVESVAKQSVLFDETMKTWLRQLDKQQREQIVDTVFSMLEEANIHTVDDFYHSTWKKVQELIKAKSELPPETQKLFSEALKLLWKTGNTTVMKNVKQRKSKKSIK
jgi:mRNA-degrading endonuclease RelE of RelBE toxin-antitoxin system